MKRYYRTNYKGSKHKWVRKLLIVLAVCVTAFALTLVLGNHLKNKLENSPINTGPIETGNTENAQTDKSDTESLKSPSKTLPDHVWGGFLSEISSDPALSVQEIKESGYNCVTFCATDNSGKIAYGSKALSELSKTKPDPSLITFETLKSVVSSTPELYFSTIYSITPDTINNTGIEQEIDCSVIAELEDIGFDDIIITGALDNGTLNSDTVRSLINYISAIRKNAAEIMIGLEIPKIMLTDPECAPEIVILSEYIDFLAIDLTNASGESNPIDYLKTVAEELKGSFNVYNMRALISGGLKSESNSRMQALRDSSVNFIQFVTPVTPDPINEPSTAPETAHTENP